MGNKKSDKNAEKYIQTKQSLSPAEMDDSMHAEINQMDIVRKIVPQDRNGEDKKYQTDWYRKKEEPAIALLEVVAQEMLRLILDFHPKTRRAQNKKNQTYVLSQIVPSERGFSTKSDLLEFYRNVENGNYKGLGGIEVGVLLVSDIDFKIKNLLLGDDGFLVKIDGDASLVNLHPGFSQDKYQRKMPENIIQAFPGIPGSFNTSNWLGERLHGNSLAAHMEQNPNYFVGDDNENLESEIALLTQSISSSESFRNGINGVNPALLSVMLLPEQLIKEFVSHYASNDKEISKIGAEIIMKKQEIEKVALNNESFLSYLKSPKAASHLSSFIHKVNNFKTMEKNYLVKDIAESEDLIKGKFDALRDKVGYRQPPALHNYPTKNRYSEQPPPSTRMKTTLPPVIVYGGKNSSTNTLFGASSSKSSGYDLRKAKSPETLPNIIVRSSTKRR
jgi:hypothetical protein